MVNTKTTTRCHLLYTKTFEILKMLRTWHIILKLIFLHCHEFSSFHSFCVFTACYTISTYTTDTNTIFSISVVFLRLCSGLVRMPFIFIPFLSLIPSLICYFILKYSEFSIHWTMVPILLHL